MKDSYGTYDGRRPEPPYETAGDHDKHGEAIESLRRQLANPELEPYHEVGLSIEQARALLSAPSATVPMPDWFLQTVASDAFTREQLRDEAKAMIAKTGPYAVTEIAPTPEGLAGMVRNQQDAGADLLRAAHAAAKAEGTPLAEERCSGWIPVNERLPTMHQTVLCWIVADDHDRPCIGTLNEGHRKPYFAIGRRDFTLKQVSHWMPLPEPPK